MAWTEISVSVKDESVEAVANFLQEAGADGAVLENNGDGTGRVIVYFPAGPAAEALLAQLDTFLRNLVNFALPPEATVKTRLVAEQDWAHAWKQYYQPVRVENIYICPSWLEPAASPQDIVLRLDPGMAFGTGAHPTTQLCLRLVAARAKGKAVLDLGSGSGILSLAAVKSGARQVVAVDNDELAIKMATENARLNQCFFQLIQGDVFAEFAAAKPDLAVANIGFEASTRLASIFQQGKECSLVLSGFPQERLSDFTAQYGDLVQETFCQEGWVCLVLGTR